MTNRCQNLKRDYDNSESENFRLLVLSLSKQSKGQSTARPGYFKSLNGPMVFMKEPEVKRIGSLCGRLFDLSILVENGASTYQYQFSNYFENRAYIYLSLSEELVFGFV